MCCYCRGLGFGDVCGVPEDFYEGLRLEVDMVDLQGCGWCMFHGYLAASQCL